MNRNSQGINLIQLMIALTIVVIFTMISVPTFLSLIKEKRLTATAEQLYQALQSARSEAIARNQPVYIIFQTGTTWCYGINVNATCDCTQANTCSLGAVQAGTSDITLSTTGLSSNSFRFDGVRGTANLSGTITFTLNSPTTSMSITVSKLGNVQICSPTVSGFQTC